MSDHCATAVIVAVRQALDGNYGDADATLDALDPHAAKHALVTATGLAIGAIRCLDAADPGHGTRHLHTAGLQLADEATR